MEWLIDCPTLASVSSSFNDIDIDCSADSFGGHSIMSLRFLLNAPSGVSTINDLGAASSTTVLKFHDHRHTLYRLVLEVPVLWLCVAN